METTALNKYFVMEEIWKDIPGYEGLYQVSNLGRVKSLRRPYKNNGGIQWTKERILKPEKDKDGYLQVNLHLEGKQKMRKVHRLVAESYILNPEGLPQVNHKDEDKTNNCVDNLEWCDAKYNSNYGSCIDRIVSSRLKSGHIKYTFPELRGMCKSDMKLYKHITYKIRRNNNEVG